MGQDCFAFYREMVTGQDRGATTPLPGVDTGTPGRTLDAHTPMPPTYTPIHTGKQAHAQVAST